MVNIHEAQTQLSKLLTRVANGEEIIIAKAGKPIARLVPIMDKHETRLPGTAKNKITVSDNFNDSLPDSVLDSFYS